MSPVQVGIVNYNSTPHLVECLRSIFQDSPFPHLKVHVQDNDSQDGVDRIFRMFPQVFLEKNPRNLGFAAAVNQMLRRMDGEYAILLNPDATLQKGFISQAIRFMERYPEVGIMGPRILDSDGRLQNSARAFPTLLTAFFGRSSFLSRKFPQNRFTSRNLLSLRSDGVSPMEVDWVSGACMVVRRKAVESVGMLDERFFMYWEDADWCRRMRDGRWRVVYYPRIFAQHYVGGSSEKRVLRSVFEFHKSAYLLFSKYHYRKFLFFQPIILGGLALRFCLIVAGHSFGRERSGQLSCSSDFLASEHKLEFKKPVRIFRFISRLNIGGPAIHVQLLTDGLNSGRFQSRLVAGSLARHEGSMGYLFRKNGSAPTFVPELQRPIRPKRDFTALLRIYRLLVSEAPDIVHSHTAKAGFTARVAAFLYNRRKKARVLTVHTFHGHIFEGYFSRIQSWFFVNIERWLARRSSAIVAISESQRRELVARFRIAPAEKVRTIPLGFDLNPFVGAAERKGEFRRRLGVSEETRIVGTIGRLAPIKNHRLFLDAAAAFLRRNPDLPVVFVVIGDGELRSQLETRARELRMADRVRFCGWVRDVPAVYADLDILGLTSINEGTPVSLIEAMAAEVPVLATAVGGVRDLLGVRSYGPPRGEFAVCPRGLVCREGDLEGFVAGLEALIRESVAHRSRRIVEARRFVQRRYGADRLIADMETLYRDLLRERDCRP